MLFSATLTEEVRQLIALSLQSPVRLAADLVGRAPVGLSQEVVRLKVSPKLVRFQGYGLENPRVIFQGMRRPLM